MTSGKALIKWVCCECGSDNIRATAQMRWNIAKQDWEVVPNTLSEPTEDYCVQCCDHRATEEVGLDFKDMALIAIERNQKED